MAKRYDPDSYPQPNSPPTDTRRPIPTPQPFYSVSVARNVCLGAPFALALHPTRPQTQPGGLGTLLVRVKKCAGPATKPSPALRQLEEEGRGETHGASFQGGWEAKCTTLPGEGEVRTSMREEGIVSSPPITASQVKGEVISAPMEEGKSMVASPENASSEWMLSLVDGIVSRALEANALSPEALLELQASSPRSNSPPLTPL